MLKHKEMTRYAFISHIEDYLKQLLKDPLHADTDEFLKYHDLNGPKVLSLLLKRSNPEDENSAIVIKTVKIKDNGFDENGKRIKDNFNIKYRIPRKDYNKKMRNLYINLFESNIIENSPLNEGAWGYGILDNDRALDNQTTFGKYALSLLTHNLENSYKGEDKWSNLGVLVDFLKKYDHEEVRFTDEYTYGIELCKNVLNDLNADEEFISTWENEGKFKSELKRIFKDVVNISYDKERLNEDGECCGATNANFSGQYTAPLFNEPIKRRTMYITQEQEEYLKALIKEESVLNTSIGDFGFDTPIGDGKNNNDNEFFKDANDHKNIMKKSWKNEK